jgi:hypothetical protein
MARWPSPAFSIPDGNARASRGLPLLRPRVS